MSSFKPTFKTCLSLGMYTFVIIAWPALTIVLSIYTFRHYPCWDGWYNAINTIFGMGITLLVTIFVMAICIKAAVDIFQGKEPLHSTKIESTADHDSLI